MGVRVLTTFGFVCALVSATGCEIGNKEEDPGSAKTPAKLPADHPSKPLEEMVRAYHDRNPSLYAALLDSGYTYLFPSEVVGDTLADACLTQQLSSPIGSGGEFDPQSVPSVQVPSAWDRDREIDATTNLFNPNFVDSFRCVVDAASELKLSFRTPLDRVAWVPYTGIKPSKEDSLEEWLEAKTEFRLDATNQDVQTISNFIMFVIRPDSVTGGVRWLIWRMTETTF